MNKILFHRKQPDASNDYEIAYNLITNIKPGQNKTIEPVNIAAFRKYAYDLAAKSGKDITTRKTKDSLLIVYCL